MWYLFLLIFSLSLSCIYFSLPPFTYLFFSFLSFFLLSYNNLFLYFYFIFLFISYHSSIFFTTEFLNTLHSKWTVSILIPEISWSTTTPHFSVSVAYSFGYPNRISVRISRGQTSLYACIPSLIVHHHPRHHHSIVIIPITIIPPLLLSSYRGINFITANFPSNRHFKFRIHIHRVEIH